MVEGSEAVQEVELEVDGAQFVLRVFSDPSGLRGQVFRGEEKVAGVQIYHSTDLASLVREVRRNRAVLRAARDHYGARR